MTKLNAKSLGLFLIILFNFTACESDSGNGGSTPATDITVVLLNKVPMSVPTNHKEL